MSRSPGFLNPEDHPYVYPRWIKTAVVPSKLIHEIYLSPSLAEWEIQTIRRFLKRRLKNTPVHESVLSGSPAYLSPPTANEVKDFLERTS
jgi:hypothetical protein